MDRWLKTDDVAQLLNVSINWIIQAIHNRHLTAVNISTGKQRAAWRIKESDVNAFIQSRLRSAASPDAGPSDQDTNAKESKRWRDRRKPLLSR